MQIMLHKVQQKERRYIMQEYRTGNAIIRIQGSPDTEKVKAATIKFLKKVQAQRKEKEKCGV